jgi:hypothetical protein
VLFGSGICELITSGVRVQSKLVDHAVSVTGCHQFPRQVPDTSEQRLARFVIRVDGTKQKLHSALGGNLADISNKLLGHPTPSTIRRN